MSYEGSYRHCGFLLSCLPHIRSQSEVAKGMEFGSSRNTEKIALDDDERQIPHMAPTTMREPSLVLPLPQKMIQEERYLPYSDMSPSSRSPIERMALPSIRQAIPEIEFGRISTERLTYSPRSITTSGGSPEHHSPDAFKRRRLSGQEEYPQEPRDYSAPRSHPVSQQPRADNITTSPMERHHSDYFTREPWQSSNRESSYQPSTLPAIRTSPIFDSPGSEFRPTLPSLTSLTLENGSSLPRRRDSWNDYVLDNARSCVQLPGHYSSASYSDGFLSKSQTLDSYGYGKSRVHSYSNSSMHMHSHLSERSPFASTGYRPERSSMSDVVGGPESNTNKHRKRRGNLPKDTTDKLRAWFVAHVTHPYPTEEEKQELMRQTRLQMNQISNWFINARRRQLPAMLNSARLESDTRSALAGRGGSTISRSQGHLNGAEEEKRGLVGLGLESDSEGNYEDDAESLESVKSADSGSALEAQTPRVKQSPTQDVNME